MGPKKAGTLGVNGNGIANGNGGIGVDGSVDDDLSTGSIRNRVSKLRVQQRTLYEELGWELPEGGATKRTANASGSSGTPTATPKKRVAGVGAGAGPADGLEAEQGTPTKKARGQVKVAGKPKAGGKKSVQQDLGRGDEGAEGGGFKVKEEVLDDENEDGQEV
ncbi:hypothetical protein IAQ61_012060 [Plenodomus lingam]|uniref:uncharacterized protein n=1 Tax=Leptosphaeria maculans TaxID=5022 RepID=UPI00331D0419|nr:hypothetical protein IAQ61_012060 [Plenodomus lingam]